ncbi:hypothetical protein [Longispora urticae]
MEAARSWIRDNPAVRDDILARFRGDARLAKDALPDALVTNPDLFVDLSKEFVHEAVRRDAPAGVAEELLVAVRRATAGTRALSPYMRTVLQSLRGLRDPAELEPVFRNALADATDADRGKLEGALELVRKYAAADGDFFDPTLETEAPEFSPVDCVACCALGCALCLELCAVCCVAGCIYCG